MATQQQILKLEMRDMTALHRQTTQIAVACEHQIQSQIHQQQFATIALVLTIFIILGVAVFGRYALFLVTYCLVGFTALFLQEKGKPRIKKRKGKYKLMSPQEADKLALQLGVINQEQYDFDYPKPKAPVASGAPSTNLKNAVTYLTPPLPTPPKHILHIDKKDRYDGYATIHFDTGTVRVAVPDGEGWFKTAYAIAKSYIEPDKPSLPTRATGAIGYPSSYIHPIDAPYPISVLGPANVGNVGYYRDEDLAYYRKLFHNGIIDRQQYRELMEGLTHGRQPIPG